MSHLVVSNSREIRAYHATTHKPILSVTLLRLSAILLLSTLLAAGFMSSCRTADPTSPNDNNEQPLVRTTVVGTVVNEAGLPVSGATVSAHGKTTTSDKNGYFVLQNVDAPKNRCVALAKLDGYFTAAKADITKENGLTQIKLFMMSHGLRKTVDAATGGTITVNGMSGIASVRFESDGLATTSGAAFNGNAQVAVRHLDPADPTFAYYFAGDETATRENGERASLISYGVLRVDIRSTSGEQLQPAPGKPAVITYPIPTTMLSSAPATIPLWYFDEQQGMWVEEGVATKQGSSYVGSVKHFTDWNADKPSENNGTLTGLVHCNGIPMPNVYVRIGQTSAYTGPDGRFLRYVPIGIDLDVVVDPATNQGVYASAPMLVPMLSSREERDISIALTSECPTSMTGILIDDQDRPIAGHVEWINDEGKVTSVTTTDGTFYLRVPANTTLQLEASSWSCVTSKSFTVTSGDIGGLTDLGRLTLCATNEPLTGDIDISTFTDNAYATLSPDGSVVAISGDAPVVVFRKASDGTLLSTGNFGGGGSYNFTLPPTFSGDGTRLSVFDINRRRSMVFEVATGTKLFSVNVASGVIMPDGNSVLAITGDSSQFPSHFARYSVATGKEIQSYALDLKPLGYVTIGGITSDGTRAVLMDERDIIVYDLINDVVIATNPAGANIGRAGVISLSADGTMMSAFGADGPVQYTAVLSTLSGQLFTKLPPLGWSGIAPLSPSGTQAAMQDSTADGTRLTPEIVRSDDGSNVRTLTTDGVPGRFTFFSFSADAKRLAGVYLKDSKKYVRLWDL